MRERILKIMSEYKLNSGQLAEIAGVQPSAISHIISGRNKPGFDFLYNLINHFKDVDPKWLITGEGEMYHTNNDNLKQEVLNDLFGSDSTTSTSKEPELMFDVGRNVEAIENLPVATRSHTRTIAQIIVLYSDNSFEIFNK